ncbi:hypothetical protein EBZ80_07825 [bacterium]|nr:hypothetical protein [bacterium]
MIRRLARAPFFAVAAMAIVSCGKDPGMSRLGSITEPGYEGKKHYFGWGEYLSGFMGNETKYDVQHTHNLFTSGHGGDYLGRQLTGRPFDDDDIRREWAAIKSNFAADDMYVQYSSGHGYHDGLAVGVTYDQMRDFALSLGARETVVFTMACYSGNLVDSFNERRADWENHRAGGRNLFVMASSERDDTSSTGPGRDPDEPNGPNGSAGSAFGHALWKALIGYADRKGNGMAGNGDGKISLQEIIAFTVRKTQQVGGHTPVYTGSYDPALVIAKVPSPAELESLLGGTEEGRRELAELRADGFL